MKVEKLIHKAIALKRVKGGLVLCGDCDNPASKTASLQFSRLVCAPCAYGEADSFDDSDLIAVAGKKKSVAR